MEEHLAIKRPTLKQVAREMARFIVGTFAFGLMTGAASSLGYYSYSHSPEKVFHSIIIFAAAAFTFPMFTISIKVMIKMYFMTLESMERGDQLFDGFRQAQETLSPMAENFAKILDKAVPIANNVDVIVVKANGMADDIERIAHKVRSAADSLNGHLDFKDVGKKLDNLNTSLEKIAKAFGPPDMSDDSESIPGISLKLGSSRRA